MNPNELNGNPAAGNHDLFHQVTVTDPQARSSSVFTVPLRYVNLRFLNAGAQGTVVSAEDQVTGQKVAIKKMQQPFVMTMSAKRAYREFVLLTSIRHPNIIRLLNAFTPQTDVSRFREVYLVMELMQHNLHEDLKPPNIVVNDECALKVLDFGLARKQCVDTAMTGYVATRYYRAPEVILGMGYSEKVDIWSIGCIFAEMITHRVLFAGRDRIDQWTSIIRVLGTPKESFISRLGHSAGMYVRSQHPYRGLSFEEILPESDFLTNTEIPGLNLTASAARDLLSKMLTIDPNDRYSVDDALHHPYLKVCFNVDPKIREAEMNAPPSENRYQEEYDRDDTQLNEWKSLIFTEVMQYQSSHDVYQGTW